MKGKNALRAVLVIVILLSVACQKRRQIPKQEIGTYDILLDYDQENGTNLAEVYRGSMDLLYGLDIRGEEMVEKIDTLDNNIVHIFGVRHLSRLAIIRFLRNVLPFIANPDDWIFLVEGCEDEDILLPEVYFFTGVARELGIPTWDPIVSPLGDEVTRKLVRGTPPMVTLKDIHFAVFENMLPDSSALDSLNKEGREGFISIITSYSVLPRDSVKILLHTYDTSFLRKPKRLNPARKVFAQIRSDMIDTSNVLSSFKVAERIDSIMQVKNIFVCVGSYHVSVFENLDTLQEHLLKIHLSGKEER